MSGLAQAAEEYLAIRRALGFKLERHGRLLPDFVAFLEHAGASFVSTDLALGWARQPEGNATWWRERLSIARGFARHLATIDPRTQVPPPNLIASRSRSSRRAVPYLYSSAEIAGLMRAAQRLRPLQAATYQTLVGLLAVTGMRVGEEIGLDRDDFDNGHSVLVVRATKLGKSREVPLHETTLGALHVLRLSIAVMATFLRWRSMSLNRTSIAFPEELHSLEEAGDGRVEAYTFASIAGEARGIAQICRELIDDADVPPGMILILLRSDPHGIYSQPIVGALAKRGLDVELPSDPFALLGDEQPRQVVCLLRLLRDRNDGLAWRELLKLRDNGVGEGALLAAYRLADERGLRYYPGLQAIVDDPDAFDHARRQRVADDVLRVESTLDGLADAFEAEAQSGLTAVLDAVGAPSE